MRTRLSCSRRPTGTVNLMQKIKNKVKYSTYCLVLQYRRTIVLVVLLRLHYHRRSHYHNQGLILIIGHASSGSDAWSTLTKATAQYSTCRMGGNRVNLIQLAYQGSGYRRDPGRTFPTLWITLQGATETARWSFP